MTVSVAGQTSPPSSSSLKKHVLQAPCYHIVAGPGAYRANTEGGQKFYISGNFFGPRISCAGPEQPQDRNCVDEIEFETMDAVDDKNKHLFKGVACSVKRAQTLIECTSPPGVGKNFAYKVIVGEQASLVNVELTNPGTTMRPSYGRPVVSTLSRSHGPRMDATQTMDDADTRGFTVDTSKRALYNGGIIPETILISGSNFGPVNSGRCEMTGRPCITDSECFNSTAGNTCEGTSSAVSWNPIEATYKLSTSEGGVRTGIGISYNATNCVVVHAHTKMKCDFAQGAGRALEWVVKVGQQDSLTPSSSYHHPIITSITGPGASDAKTNGMQQVIINGYNFGPFQDGVSVSYGPTGVEYIPKDCAVVSHLEIMCTTVPGIGNHLYWKVTVQEQSNELSATTSYAAPIIHSITPNVAPADGSNLDGFLAYLNVSSSGLADPLANIFVQFDAACEEVVNTCGLYEIAIEPMSPSGTRFDGDTTYWLFAYPCSEIRSPQNIEASVIVFPTDRQSSSTIRTAVISQNSVSFLQCVVH